MTKILLADDSVTIQKVVELTFSEEESQVIAVGDGATALERVQLERPDIILSDVIMPGMNGYELCQKVKSDPHLSAIPFLFLKGTFESFDEEKAMQCGADGFIVKPFESQELISKVNELVARAGTGVDTGVAPLHQAQAAAPQPPQPPPAAAPPPAQPVTEAPRPPMEPLAAAAELTPAAPPTPPHLAEEESPFDLDLGPGEKTEEAHEEDLWSEVSLRESSSPLVDDKILEEESFWGAGAEEQGPSFEEIEAPAGEALLEEVAEHEIQDLSQETMEPPPAQEPTPPAQPPVGAVAPSGVFEPQPAAPPPEVTPAAAAPPRAEASPVSVDDLEQVLGTKIEDAIQSSLGPAISEAVRKIVEEVAWEVIPDLAESMIRGEIERIRQRKDSGEGQREAS